MRRLINRLASEKLIAIEVAHLDCCNLETPVGSGITLAEGISGRIAGISLAN